MNSQLQSARWLEENGPKEMELLFRALVFQPSVPILIADNDRYYREASVGAGNFLGLPREKIIGRSLDDFADPGFKPVLLERWRTFLQNGSQEGTLPLTGPDGTIREVEYSAKGNVLPIRHLIVLSDKKPKSKSVGTPKGARTGPRSLILLGCGTTHCSC
jgi:PAS domain-containing protein